MQQDPTRPVFHLTAPMGWIYDPSGAFYFQGKYHVFSYHQIHSFLLFNSHDHYVSEDLVHWHTWPLGPVADSAIDCYGIWLGNHVIDDDGVPTIVYGCFDREGDGSEHGVRAISGDGLISYSDKKVVFPEYHDGHVWRDGETWYAITMRHSAVKNFKDPEILVLTSSDLDHWTERGVLFKFPSDFTFVEFPYLFSLGGKDVLMAGCYPGHDSRYWIGSFDRESFRFIPDDPEGLRIDYSNAFHCFNPSTLDAQGPGGSQRRIIMAMEMRPHGDVNGLPWNGVHAMPRVLTLDGDRLHQQPLPEMETLRGAHQSRRDIEIPSGVPVCVEKTGDALEIVAEFENRGARIFGLNVRLSSDKQTYVRVFYDSETDECGVEGNIQSASLSSDVTHGRGPAYCGPSKPVQIRVFLDKILVEAFVNGQTCTTSLRDTNPTHNGLELFSEGGTALCTRLDIWDIAPSYPHDSV
jgi:sucrose-6-phosphate hydrolase SacC (GH32 family)